MYSEFEKKEMKISRTDYFRRISYGNPYSIAEKKTSIQEILYNFCRLKSIHIHVVRIVFRALFVGYHNFVDMYGNLQFFLNKALAEFLHINSIQIISSGRSTRGVGGLCPTPVKISQKI